MSLVIPAERKMPASAGGPFLGAWRHRHLIYRLAEREIRARYRGSMLGLAWSVMIPLMMLGVYTFVFSVVFQARWDVPMQSDGQFALLTLTGLIFYTVFSEAVGRAPGLVLANTTYVKKVVFPLEILPWVVLLVALFNAMVTSLTLMLGYVVLIGIPPWTALLLPVAFVPLALLTLGLCWFLASVGVYLRDIQQLVGVLLSMLLFLSPIFYPLSAIPAGMRAVVQLSPVTIAIEGARSLLFWGVVPDWQVWAAYMAVSVVVAWLGWAWFRRTRHGFADVL